MADNKTMMQYFEWYLPNDGFWWERCASKAESLAQYGVTDIWLPPAYKGTSQDDVGYGVYDMYDLGEFDQKGTVRTKYGTKKEYIKAIQAFHDAGIRVYADIVLNHRMGGDELEDVQAVMDSPEDRTQQISEPKTIRVWSKFTFPGRNGAYSKFTWNQQHFSGADWDELTKQKGNVYRFTGRQWSPETDPEKGNFDYLMGMNVDMSNPEVKEETKKWLSWYLRTTDVDALRLDAVKHIDFPFYRDLLKEIRSETGREIPAVGEYWSGDLGRLLHYLDSVDNSMSLFDVALHYHFFDAAQGGGTYDISHLLENTLVSARPGNAVTFVDNHDTQYGQSLQSFVSDWFKQIAYSIILLRKDGVPCVFYTDFYGNPGQGRPLVPNLQKLIMLRHSYAYGEQEDYFDDPHVIGWVRRGDSAHRNSGFAVLLSNAEGGKKRMYMGDSFRGTLLHDAMGICPEPVEVGDDGWAEFRTEGGSVSVWVREKALENLVVNG